MSKGAIVRTMKSISEELERIDDEIQKALKAREKTRSNSIAARLLFASVVCAVVAGVVVWIAKRHSLEWLGWAGVGLLAASMLALAFGALFLCVPLALTFFKRSAFGLLVENTQLMEEAFSRNLRSLLQCSEASLECAKRAFDVEINGFRRRTELLVGATDKLGLLPAALAFVAITSELKKIAGGLQLEAKFLQDFSSMNGAFGIIAYAYISLYAVALISRPLLWRMERSQQLLEAAITLKQRSKTSSPTEV